MVDIMEMQNKYSQQRSPTLNTVMMVEETLENQEEIISISQLKRILPKQIMHQTLMAVLNYLEYSGKITISNRKVLWTFKPVSKLKQMKGLTLK
ncbi:MAG: hypothetical protein ACMXYF_03280 [Candidatus Woesearchaeota archaeon]